MGLDFTISDAHWSYGGFMRFRMRLAQEIGINLNTMQGFGGTISWEKIKDPIKYFLHHSDCDGSMSVKQCYETGKRLRELVKDWDKNDYDKQQALELAKDMISTEEPCEFC